MSANNWGVCPRCWSRRVEITESQEVEAAKQYGKVPIEEWRELTSIAQASRASLSETLLSLREDYDIGVDDEGLFTISYRGGCHVCGLTFRYDYSNEVPL